MRELPVSELESVSLAVDLMMSAKHPLLSDGQTLHH